MSKAKKNKKTKIRIDYSICGEKGKIDPRNCGLCMKACDPAVFIMHETIGTEKKQKDIYDPQDWRITSIWGSILVAVLNVSKFAPKMQLQFCLLYTSPSPRDRS